MWFVDYLEKNNHSWQVSLICSWHAKGIGSCYLWKSIPRLKNCRFIIHILVLIWDLHLKISLILFNHLRWQNLLVPHIERVIMCMSQNTTCLLGWVFAYVTTQKLSWNTIAISRVYIYFSSAAYLVYEKKTIYSFSQCKQSDSRCRVLMTRLSERISSTRMADSCLPRPLFTLCILARRNNN